MAQRRGRNSIPAVNGNPRPPNEPRFGIAQAQPARARAGVGNNQPANKKRSSGLSGPIGGNVGGNIGASNASPAASSPPAAFAPPTDPRDARYWQDMAQLTFNKDIGLKKLGTEDVFSKTQLDREISNRDYLDPIEVQRNRENANVGGIIYSTAHQEDLGNLGQEQFQKRASVNEAYQRALANRALERQGIEGEYNLGSSNIGLEATERASQAELERAALVAEMGGEPGGEPLAPGASPQAQAIANRANKNKPKRNQPINNTPKKNSPISNRRKAR